MPKSAYNTQLGKRIAKARQDAGLSVRQLAERLGWEDHSRLTNYETGRRAITVEMLVTIASALALAPATFLVDSQEAVAIVQHIATNRERAQQLLYLSTQLDLPEPPTPEESAVQGTPVPADCAARQ